MKRAEAELLVGKPVVAWTAANGQYVGTLLEVLSSRPWRGVVQVTGVLEPAQHFENGGACRRGFRPGETLEVGHSSLKAATEETGPGQDYLSALHLAQQDHQARHDARPEDRYAWVNKGFADALTLAIAAEERRLQGLPWELKPRG